MLLEIIKKLCLKEFIKVKQKNFITTKRKKNHYFCLYIYFFFQIPCYRIFQIHQGAFPESLRYLSQKM